jgi:hypothetical protein
MGCGITYTEQLVISIKILKDLNLIFFRGQSEPGLPGLPVLQDLSPVVQHSVSDSKQHGGG